MIYISYAFILYLPPHYSWFEQQRNLMAMGQVMVGFVEFPMRFLQLLSLFTSGALNEFMGIVAFIYFIFAGLGVGIVTQFL